MKSAYSKKLEEYASGIEGSYPDFVLAMGIIPQRHGIDKKLWEYVEENQPDYDELMAARIIFDGTYLGEATPKELAAAMKERVRKRLSRGDA